jgi:hypothetical protein
LEFANPFDRWFSESKVKDRAGEPMVVYHGTDAPGFTVFETQDKSLEITKNALGENIGSFFAGNANHAKDFGKNVSAYYLSLQAPAIFDSQDDFRAFMREHSGRTPDIRDSEGFIVEEGQFQNQMREALELAGFDGVMIKRPGYTKTASSDKPWFIAFYPEQIKLAAGNIGTFQPGNADTRFSRNPDTQTQVRRGFHGSSHKFDRFSLENIGAGEGAAAYGYGLYFAEKRDVAEFYKDVLSQPVSSSIIHGWDVQSRSAVAKDLLSHLSMDQAIDYAREREGRMRGLYDGVANELQAIKERGKSPTEGYLYEAQIPGNRHLLDWDRPISEQHSDIQDIIRHTNLMEHLGNEAFGISAPMVSGGELYDQISHYLDRNLLLIEDPQTGEQRLPSTHTIESAEREAEARGRKLIHKVKETPAEATSAYLNSIGVLGLKYQDQFSRESSQAGTSNFVIWDDSAITITAINDQKRQIEAAPIVAINALPYQHETEILEERLVGL